MQDLLENDVVIARFITLDHDVLWVHSDVPATTIAVLSAMEDGHRKVFGHFRVHFGNILDLFAIVIAFDIFLAP